MNASDLTQRQAKDIKGVLHCFDRLVLFGTYKSIGWPGAMERCSCYKVGKNATTGFLPLQWSPGKCQHFYVYFIDERFGPGYLRIPTWAPFRLQAYCNGQDWLGRQMKARMHRRAP